MRQERICAALCQSPKIDQCIRFASFSNAIAARCELPLASRPGDHTAIETLPRGEDGLLREKPEIQSDNGSSFIAREFLKVLKEHGLGHHRIRPHCPEENGVIERSFRTLREALEGEELSNLLEAERVLARLVRWYNEERLHSAVDYLPPAVVYRGRGEERNDERRRNLAQARHCRREGTLGLQQSTLPFSSVEETVANT